MGNTRGSVRIVVAVVGVVVVAAYAALLAVNALVLDPLAAVPGRRWRRSTPGSMRWGAPPPATCGACSSWRASGVALAVAAAVVGLAARLPATVIAVIHLGVLAAGGLATFQSGFFLGMDVADSFMIETAPPTRSGPACCT